MISVTTLAKTGTKIIKDITSINGKKYLTKTIQYGKDSPMVTKYGIDKIVKKYYKGSEVCMDYFSYDNKLFTVGKSSIGKPDSLGSFGCVPELENLLVEGNSFIGTLKKCLDFAHWKKIFVK